jgi:ribonuclease VapC
MFVDASAIVAILTREPEADRLVDRLDAAEGPTTSAIAIFEAVAGICRKRRITVAEGLFDVRAFLEAARVQVLPIGEADAEVALDAFARYGEGRGHPAQLNLGDCFAYAIARGAGVGLLFVGEDFARTDIASAKSSP